MNEVSSSFVEIGGLGRAELVGVEEPAALDHPPDGLGILDIFQRIPVEQDDVGELAERFPDCEVGY